MTETRRKLTTIFSADVYGYSRMMEADEEGTLARLKRLRDAMARLIEAHSGRVVNTWGDGLLAEFASVVEAVRTAVDVQGELARIDDAGDGVTITAMTGRTDTRVYVKAVAGGEGEHELSPEERQAVSAAMTSAKKLRKAS